MQIVSKEDNVHEMSSYHYKKKTPIPIYLKFHLQKLKIFR